MDERQRVKLAQAGSEEAFADLVRAYQGKVFSLALGFVRNREAADDLAQEVFLKAYLALPKFRSEAEFGTWLYRIAVNHFKDHLRRRGRIREVSLEDVRELPEAGTDETGARERERETEERRRLVHRALDGLPEKYRLILTLRDVQGLPYEEIAAVLKLSPGTVDSRLHRARRLLRRKLAPHLGREGERDAL
jgi:RNA polymerase sigma-70 factor (ECF subfamily)